MSEEIQEEVKHFKFRFDVGFQKKLLNLLVNNVDFLIKATKYLKPEYFDTEVLQWFYKMTSKYYDEFGKKITQDVFASEIKKLEVDKHYEYILAVKGIYTTIVFEEEYVIQQLEEFIKRNIFVKRFQKAGIEYNNQRFTNAQLEIKELVTEMDKVSLDSADRSFFFEDAKARALRRDEEREKGIIRYPSFVWDIDTILGGGLSKGEIGIIQAVSKKGKSIWLSNIGAGITSCNFGNVLHINLEGKRGQCDDRYEARLQQEEYRKVVRNEALAPDYKYIQNKLVITNFLNSWDYTVLDVEREILDLRAHNFKPDVLIVDYGDLLKPRKASRDSTYQSQEEVYRDLKTLAIKYDLVCWTAAQMARPPVGANPDMDSSFIWTRHKLADSYAKVRIADALFTLNQTLAEKEAKRMRIYVDSLRDNPCGQIVNISQDYSKMMFYVESPVAFESMYRKMGHNA